MCQKCAQYYGERPGVAHKCLSSAGGRARRRSPSPARPALVVKSPPWRSGRDLSISSESGLTREGPSTRPGGKLGGAANQRRKERPPFVEPSGLVRPVLSWTTALARRKSCFNRPLPAPLLAVARRGRPLE